MTDIADLQQRVQSVAAHLRGTSKESRMRNDDLSSRLRLVEEGIARSQQQIERLTEALACAKGEKKQIQTLLQTLLATVETAGARGIGAGMRDSENQIDRLLKTAMSVGKTLSSSASEITENTSVIGNTYEQELTAAGLNIETEPVTGASKEVPENAPLELTQMLAEDGSVAGLNTAQGDLDTKDRSALHKIINRVSPRTGSLYEEQNQAYTTA